MTRAAAVAALATAALAASGCPSAPCEPGWRELTPAAGPLDRVVLAVVEGAPGEIWLVGGGLDVVGAQALVLRLDEGGAVAELSPGRDETLWWVWPAPQADEVWAVGAAGLVLRGGKDGASWAVVPSPSPATLFGVFGFAGDDVWIVGGEPGLAGANDDVVLHWDGQALTRDLAVPARGATLFKMWGAAPDDFWVVGESGTILRRQAGAWVDHSAPSLTMRSLTTVHGCAADDVWAVGGDALLHWDGATWTRLAEPVLLSDANGVACGADSVLVVGNGGLKLRLDRASGLWHDEQLETPWDTDFHGALAASDGTLYAVGGNFNAPAAAGSRTGRIGRRLTCD